MKFRITPGAPSALQSNSDFMNKIEDLYSLHPVYYKLLLYYLVLVVVSIVVLHEVVQEQETRVDIW